MGHKDLASTIRYLKAGFGKDLLARVNAAFEVIGPINEPVSGKRRTLFTSFTRFQLSSTAEDYVLLNTGQLLLVHYVKELVLRLVNYISYYNYLSTLIILL